MVTIASFAQRILDENKYTTSDVGSLTKLEYMIDNAIDIINLRAGTSIADLSGTAETKSIIGTESEILVVKELTVLLIRALKDRGPATSPTTMNVSAVLADPQYDFYSKAIREDIKHLCGRGFDKV